jgi:uncharacterized protein (DUF488 family)
VNIFSIGYEGLSVQTFLELLSEHGIETVVDVRKLPLSRKPGFSKNALRQLLENVGLGYVHLAELGCPKSVRNRYREDSDWSLYTAGFLNHLSTQSGAIEKLSSLAKSSNCALLCFEADFNFCHRSMVADAVRARSGARIEHIDVKAVRKMGSAELGLTLA